MNDLVNHPEHYKLNKEFEVIDIIDSHVDGINDGREAVYSSHVLRYILRYRQKGGLESLKKAQWYLNRQIDYMEERQSTYGLYRRRYNEGVAEQMDKTKGDET